MKPVLSATGVVTGVSGLSIEVKDRMAMLGLGDRVLISLRDRELWAEVITVGDGSARCLPFGSTEGLQRGAIAVFDFEGGRVKPSADWLGRIVNALGEPIDGKGPLPEGPRGFPLRAAPPLSSQRERLGKVVDPGVAAMSIFTPVRQGQRIGVFSGAGVGKSSLLSMIARHTICDVNVIALIGERGREVREFVEDSLGEAGLAKSVVIVATSDEAAVMRREAAFLAMTVAEYFRDGGAHVLCLVDSLTRIATAQREIGLAAGEPPTTKGYTPSVFSLLPKLLERAGTGATNTGGAVTGVFSVLVEGDDADEPVADSARALLDGHIVLSRKIAERGRFPAIDVLKSVSRTANSALSAEEAKLAERARRFASLFEDMREMIAIGAYKRGSNHEIDHAIQFQARLEELLTQQPHEVVNHSAAFEMLRSLLAETEGEIFDEHQ